MLIIHIFLFLGVQFLKIGQMFYFQKITGTLQLTIFKKFQKPFFYFRKQLPQIKFKI